MINEILNTFSLLILVFLSSALLTPFGSLLCHKKEINKIECYCYYTRILIYSLVILSFLALIINFIFPLNIFINNLILFFGLLVLFYFKKKYFRYEYFLFLILISLTVFILIAKSHIFRPDGGLYHLPYISILNHEKIIFGLTNLHFRYGFVSIIQYSSAIFNNTLLGSNGITLPAALIFSAVSLNFLFQILKYSIEKNYNIHLFFLFFSLIFIYMKMGRYSEFGNDTPAHLLFLFLMSEMIKNNFKHKPEKIQNFFIIAIFIFLNKLLLIISILFPLIFVTKKNFKNIFLSKKVIFASAFLLLWILKNIIVSGCALYPIKISCVSNVEWTDKNKTQFVATEAEAWTKGWVNYKDKISHLDYLENFNWIKTWSKNNGYKTLKIIFPYFIILSLLTIFFKSSKKITNNYIYLKYQIIIKKIFIIYSIGILIWFLKSPDYRFGASIFVGLIALFFSNILTKYIIKKNSNKTLMTILFLSIVFFTLKNSNRIFLTSKSYNNSPWPKYFSHGEQNILPSYRKIDVDGKNIYIPENYCMYGPSPCSNVSFNLSIKKKTGYYFFYKKNHDD